MKHLHLLTTIVLGNAVLAGCQSRNFVVSQPEVVPYFSPEPAGDMPEFPPLREQSVPDSTTAGQFSPERFAENPAVKVWLRYFRGKGKDSLRRYLVRGAPFRDLIQKNLEREEMPGFLYFVPVIESGFNLKARSVASAVGPWQFMSGTGRRFGLRVNQFVDERRDIYRSTAAACLYLKRLHKVFNSWPLALAAYNAGESRVMNAILKTGTRNYWILSRKKALPKETRNYVPKFIAAYLLAKLPDYRPENTTPAPRVASFLVPPMSGLKKVSATTGISIHDLRKYNPHLRKGITPPGRKPYRLWIPENLRPSHAAIAALKKIRPDTGGMVFRHKVRPGESLYRIARKYGSGIAQLKRLNNIRGSRIRPGQILVVPAKKKKRSLVQYKVRKGDNLIQLARKFGMSVRILKKINSISRSRIYAGQVLLVQPSGNYKSI